MYEPQYELKSFESMSGAGRVKVFSRLMAALVEADVQDMATVKRPPSSRMRAVSAGDTWQDSACVAMTGHGTVPSIVAYRVAELRHGGEKKAGWEVRGGAILVKRASGAYEDPAQGVSWGVGRAALATNVMWTPTLQLKSFESTPATLKMRVICKMLDVLHEANGQWLAAGGKAPHLYDSKIFYKEEELGHDQWQDMPRTIQLGFGDCFPQGTLLLRDDFRLVPIEEISVGDRIWGRDAWTTVERKWFKGPLSVDAVMLNNGSTVCLTGDHHLFVGVCSKHPQSRDDGYGCSCPLPERRAERVLLRDVQPKQVLVTPERVAFGRDDSLDPERALVEGYYAADGWGEGDRFAISGQDGGPKERQKREVREICGRLGISTYWAKKYIRVNDVAWAQRLIHMGHYAPQKRLLSINLAEAQAAATLRGVLADSDRASGGNANGGLTFTTTSHTLAVQTRVLLKMFGRDSSWAYIENHGGLGLYPIYRLGVRGPRVKSRKLLRVRSVERDVYEAPCWDIQTSDHYVYLPEHDVTVSNCEDLASWRVSELRHAGEPAQHTVEHRKSPTLVLYHIRVRRQNGAIEDPSCRLGMSGTCQVLVSPDQVGHQTSGVSPRSACSNAGVMPEDVIAAAFGR